MEQEKIYTIDDVARELGVSTTTVSRALSGKGRISEQTRAKVRAFVEEHNYAPNVIARSLANHKTYNIGLVIPKNFSIHEMDFFTKCMEGICEMASEYGYDILVLMEDGNDTAQISRLISNRKVDGIILSRAYAGSAVQDYLVEKKVPCVVIGPSDHPEISSVDNENREAGCELTGFLLMKGLQKLALIGGGSTYLVTEDRKRGFLDAHEKHGKKWQNGLLFLDVDSDLKAMRAVELALARGADGIVCMDDYICGMVLSCLREKNVSIPEEICIASMYDNRRLERNIPPVSAVQFNTSALGRRACAVLLQKLEEPVVEEMAALNYQVVLRTSTK